MAGRSWVVPAGILVAILAVAFSGFLWRLPRRTRVLIAGSGCLYVGGALGVESVGGYFAETAGTDRLGYSILTTVEELLEMVGVVVFVYALLLHLRALVPAPSDDSAPRVTVPVQLASFGDHPVSHTASAN